MFSVNRVDNMSAETTALLCMAVVFGLPVSALAANENGLEESLRSCARHVDDGLRLACVDELIATVTGDSASAPEKAEDADDVSASRPAISNPPSDNVTVDGSTEEGSSESHADDTLTYNVTRTYQDKRKRWYFEMENGEIWLQTEARFIPAIRQFPAQVRISKGVFGSHDLRSDHFSGSIKVKKFR